MATMQNAKQIKVVLLGDSGTIILDLFLQTNTYFVNIGVGKSSIMLRFVTGNFSEDSEPTLGGAFMAKLCAYRDKHLKY